MTSQTISGSGRLLTMSQDRAYDTGAIQGPWTLVIEDGRVHEVREGEPSSGDPEDVIDVGTSLCTPGFVDPHTHLIYAGDRNDEVAARTRGAPYTGGGILRTVAATTAASDADVVTQTRDRLRLAIDRGTTTLEMKSGYGLDPARELRLLRLILEVARDLPVRVRRTYLGAHAVPEGATSGEQTKAVISSLPSVAREADYVDVFCEPRLFDLDLTRAIAEAAATQGLPLKLHADQLERSGAARLGVELGALSVDHLEQLRESDAAYIAASSTVATILPGPALMLGSGSPPARALLDAGALVAIGSDANAGTFGEPSMSLAVGLALGLHLSIDEALWAGTSGGAAALGMRGTVGHIGPGASADIVAWDAEHEGAFAFRLGGVRPLRTWFEGVTHE